MLDLSVMICNESVFEALMLPGTLMVAMRSSVASL